MQVMFTCILLENHGTSHILHSNKDNNFRAGDSRSEGCEFESQHRILDGHISYLFVLKTSLLEKTDVNEKEAGDGPFKKTITVVDSIAYQCSYL